MAERQNPPAGWGGRGETSACASRPAAASGLPVPLGVSAAVACQAASGHQNPGQGYSRCPRCSQLLLPRNLGEAGRPRPLAVPCAPAFVARSWDEPRVLPGSSGSRRFSAATGSGYSINRSQPHFIIFPLGLSKRSLAPCSTPLSGWAENVCAPREGVFLSPGIVVG